MNTHQQRPHKQVLVCAQGQITAKSCARMPSTASRPNPTLFQVPITACTAAGAETFSSDSRRSRQPATQTITTGGIYLGCHKTAVAAPIHVRAGERQSQADVFICQTATKVRDHQPGAASCERHGASRVSVQFGSTWLS